MKIFKFVLVAHLVAFGLIACKNKGAQSEAEGTSAETQLNEPERVKVQHILIAFKGTLPGQNVERSADDAKKLAMEVFEKAKAKDADFEALVKQYSEDRPPGVYEMTNSGVQATAGAFPREGMVPAFGNVGFKLKVGEVGIAEFDPQTSPFGYHIIKRLN